MLRASYDREAPGAAHRPKEAAGSDCLRVLLIDDDDDDRFLAIRELHRQLGAVRVEEVANRRELARALDAGDFEIVVTDYALGWSDGLEIFRQVQERFPECPVILFTGAVGDEFAVGAMKAGITDYVLKEAGPAARLAPAVGAAVEHSRQVKSARAAEEALRRSERQFRALIEHGTDLITVLDPEGTIRYASPSVPAFLRQPPSAIVGRHILDLFRGEERERFGDALEEVRRKALGEAVAVHDVRVHDPDGSPRVLDGLLINVIDDPAVGGIVTTARDITERRRAEEALRKKEEQFLRSQKMEAVGRLAGGVAHDFNNLLTAISCFNDIMIRSLPDDDSLREQSAEIQKAVSRASGLTRQLLAFSRRQVMRPEVIDLATIVADLEPMLRRLIGEDVDLRIVTNDPSPRTLADPGQIEQVVLNLVVNARDAMPNGGRLTITTGVVASLPDGTCETPDGQGTGPWSFLAVEDTGVGIAAEIRTSLFEPFVTTKDPERGTGLGLSTVYGIVRQSEGEIAVRSEEGRGTTFQILLPFVDAPTRLRAGSTGFATDPQGNETILLVEDEEMVRVPVSTVLRRSGYVVLEARSGADALQVIARNPRPIDLLLTDVVMPGMSGGNLAAQVRERFPGMRILYTSGYSDHPALRTDRLVRGAAFLHKPFAPDALLRRVREVLDGPSAPPQATGGLAGGQ